MEVYGAGQSPGDRALTTLQTGIRTMNEGKREIAELPLTELEEVYWKTLRRAIRLAEFQDEGESKELRQASASEAQITREASTIIVHALNACEPQLEPPRATQLAAEAYRRYGECGLGKTVLFDFEGSGQP